MIKLPLTNSEKVALIDDEDSHCLQYNWYLHDSRGCTYVRSTSLINGKRVLLHRYILNPPEDLRVDHINGDGLNNCRSNLRIVTVAQNTYNKTRFQGGNSKYKGVHKGIKRTPNHIKLFQAYGSNEDKQVFIGYFYTELEAAIAYDNWALENYGEFAFLNRNKFPEDFVNV